MFYFYKTTNLINGKFYYGSGQKDDYLGSGRDLIKAIKKYGKENFKMKKLKMFETRNEAFIFEERFLRIFKIKENKSSYNLTNFGNGGNRIDYEREDSIKYRQNSRNAITKWNMSERSKQINRDRLLENNPMNDLDSRKKAIEALENEHPMKGKIIPRNREKRCPRLEKKEA